MEKKKYESTVEIVGDALTKIEKSQYYTPEQLQTMYFKEMVIMLAALDDDLKELIKTLKTEKNNE